MLENLFEQLQNFSDMEVVEGVERHDREFRDHVAEGHEGWMLIHIEQQDCSDIRHPLNISYVWSVHSEGLKYSL